jgi:hypothetical protein
VALFNTFFRHGRTARLGFIQTFLFDTARGLALFDTLLWHGSTTRHTAWLSTTPSTWHGSAFFNTFDMA